MSVSHDIDGAIIADLIIGVDEHTRVSVHTRPVVTHYGRGGQWIQVRSHGRLVMSCLRSDRGWESTP